MNASLIIIGNEITRGMVQDKHLMRIGFLLSSLGVRVEAAYVINDSHDIRHYISIARSNSSIIITTGGLGPTEDDKTRNEVSYATSRPLRERAEALENVNKALVCGFLGPSNRRQALIPEGFSVITNNIGTAPGFYGVVDGKLYACLPGPPREAELMLSPLRNAIRRFCGAVLDKCSVYSLFLVSEARFNDLSTSVLAGMRNDAKIEIGTCFRDYKIDVLVYYENELVRDEYVKRLGRVISKEENEPCFFEGDFDISEKLGKALSEKRLTISVAESVTGGLISKILTDTPGSSKHYISGMVSYSNGVKMADLNVRPETLEAFSEVSGACASEMSVGCSTKFCSDIAIATTGYAGPEGADVGKVFVSVSFNHGNDFETKGFRFLGSRDFVRRRTAVAGMLMAYRAVMEHYGDGGQRCI